jgi:L-2,4-diaminobutyrate transaminase
VGSNRFVGEVRGEGLMAAVEFDRNRDDRVLFDPNEKVGACTTAVLLERGVIGRAMPQGDILGFAPPLCLTREEADIVVDATKSAIETTRARFESGQHLGY